MSKRPAKQAMRNITGQFAELDKHYSLDVAWLTAFHVDARLHTLLCRSPLTCDKCQSAEIV